MKEEIKTIASIATAFSALVTAVMVFFTVKDINDRAEKERIASWQTPIIYGAIRESPGITFSDIKVRYLSSASQLELPIPTKARQDEEVIRSIIDLQKWNVIQRLPNGGYIPAASSPAHDKIEKNMVSDFDNRTLVRKVYERTLLLVEGESGKYTVSDIHQKLTNEGLEITLEMVTGAIGDLRSQRLIAVRDGDFKLFRTADTDAPK